MSLLSGQRLMERLKRGDRFVADGGMGSELIRAGIPPQATLEANLRLPNEVLSIHERYVHAGAEILSCNTFGLRDGSAWPEEIQTGAALALKAAVAADRELAVWASLPGSIVASELQTLRSCWEDASLRPDVLLIETCISLNEAVSGARAARILPFDVVAVSAHFRADGRMPDGSLPTHLARALQAEGVDIIGANCGENPESFIEIAQQMRSATSVPILIQPSAGLPQQASSGAWHYALEPSTFANIALRLFTAGANIIGGCCGTTPAHIAALCAALQS